MKLGCCIGMDYYDLLVSSGYDTIALAARDVVAWDEEYFNEVRKKLEAGPLERISLNGFGTPDMRLNGTGYNPEKIRVCMEKLAPRARKLGYRYIGIGAPGCRNLMKGDSYEESLKQFRYTMEMMAEIAASDGVEILLESVCSLECNFIRTMREAFQHLQQWKISGLHLVYDIYHEFMEEQPIQLIQEIASEIRVVHMADNDNGQRIYLEANHADMYAAYWDALTKAGYKGEWNIEALKGDPAAGIPRSIEIMKKVKGE